MYVVQNIFPHFPAASSQAG